MQPASLASPHEVVLGAADGRLRWLDLRAKAVVAEWTVEGGNGGGFGGGFGGGGGIGGGHGGAEQPPVRALCVDADEPAFLYVAFGNGHLQVNCSSVAKFGWGRFLYCPLYGR